MPTPALIERVRELHGELGDTQPTAPEHQSELANLRQQLDTVLLEPDNTQHYSSLRDWLSRVYAGFEKDHPKLAGAMQGVIAELTAAGI